MSFFHFIGKQLDYEMNLTDHGVLKYDNTLGQFTSIDPMWEKYYGWTPYHYCRNNPLMAVDRNVKDEGAFGTWFAFGPIWNLMSDQKIVTVQDIVNECDNNPTYAKMIETWRIAGEMGLGEFAAELGVELIVSGIQKIKDGFQIIKGVLQSKKTDDLINAANEADRAGFTEAGRSLTKKSGRGDAAYPSAKGTAAEINNQAQSLIGGILNNTKRVTTIRHTCRYGYVIEIKIPNGQGVRYDVNGKFIGLINN